jgi:acetyltransferase
MRFMGALRHLPPALLARFTQIDYDREMAFVATHAAGKSERQVAVARYATLPDARTCEYAIVVADAWQGRGLARKMMLRLIEVAQGRGLATMIGFVDASNEAMLALCAQLGFAIAAEPGDLRSRRVTLDLSGRPGPASSSA